jgi:hypothetical protein
MRGIGNIANAVKNVSPATLDKASSAASIGSSALNAGKTVHDLAKPADPAPAKPADQYAQGGEKLAPKGTLEQMQNSISTLEAKLPGLEKSDPAAAAQVKTYVANLKGAVADGKVTEGEAKAATPLAADVAALRSNGRV